MSWMNSDGLFVKFGKEEGQVASGGWKEIDGNRVLVEVQIPYTELLSATDAIVGSVANPGAFGVELPEGLRIEAIETVVTTAFTSSGTIGTATLVFGLKKASDRSTELDHNGLLTASFTGGNLDAVGERTYIVPGSTGAGALIGTTLSENGVLSASNSQHGSHPYTAGSVKVRIWGFYP
jgi:hypothetical protein